MEETDQRLLDLEGSQERITLDQSVAACLSSHNSQLHPDLGTAIKSERGGVTYGITTQGNEIQSSQASQFIGRRQRVISIAWSDDSDGTETKPVIQYKKYITSYWEDSEPANEIKSDILKREIQR